MIYSSNLESDYCITQISWKSACKRESVNLVWVVTGSQVHVHALTSAHTYTVHLDCHVHTYSRSKRQTHTHTLKQMWHATLSDK